MHATDTLETELTARRLATAPLRARTYLSLFYLALAFPLGIAYFVAVTVGLSTGVGMAFTLVGIPILLVTILGATVVAAFEARMTSLLVGVDVPLPEAISDGFVTDEDDGPLEALKRLLTAPTTWTSVLLLVVKFIFGIVAFVLLVTVGSVIAVLLAAPLAYDQPGTTYQFGTYTVETLPAALGLFGAGAVLALVALPLFYLLALGGGLLTAALLDVDLDSSEREVGAGD